MTDVIRIEARRAARRQALELERYRPTFPRKLPLPDYPALCPSCASRIVCSDCGESVEKTSRWGRYPCRLLCLYCPPFGLLAVRCMSCGWEMRQVDDA